MRVKVCDALCGAGKTLSCINMMNSDTEHKYIFITPYLDEVDRIKRSCSGRGFISPEKRSSNNYSKLRDLPELIRQGKNIASTHALFACYTDEIKELIRAQHYILVLDEVIDLFQPVNIATGDVEFLKRNKVAREENDSIVWEDDEYSGVVFSDIMRISKSRDMVNYDGKFYFWALPIDVFRCFDEAYVLTYLFEYQLLKYFFDVHGVQYDLIGTRKINGIYQFCELTEMDRRRDLSGLIHIVGTEKQNAIGKANYSLSSGWFDRAYQEDGKPKLAIIKKNLYNIFRHTPSTAETRMWTTLTKYRSFLKGKGYANSFVSFNRRASNEYADKKYLAYCVNVFMMPWMKNYLHRLGIAEINQDMYALSVLVQWLFRSAIRKEEEVWIYIPSRRMRYLLCGWIENLARGEDLKEMVFRHRAPTGAREKGEAKVLTQYGKRRGGADNDGV